MNPRTGTHHGWPSHARFSEWSQVCFAQTLVAPWLPYQPALLRVFPPMNTPSVPGHGLSGGGMERPRPAHTYALSPTRTHVHMPRTHVHTSVLTQTCMYVPFTHVHTFVHKDTCAHALHTRVHICEHTHMCPAPTCTHSCTCTHRCTHPGHTCTPPHTHADAPRACSLTQTRGRSRGGLCCPIPGT